MLLDVIKFAGRLAQIHITIETSFLQAGYFVGGLAHDMGHTLGTLQIGSAVGHHDVLCRDEHSYLTANRGVVVDLFKRRAGDRQGPQELFVLRAVLRHPVGKLVVHVVLHTQSGIFLIQRLFADDLRLDRPHGGEGLHDPFSLEANHGLSEHGVEHAAGPVPRLGTVFVLQA